MENSTINVTLDKEDVMKKLEFVEKELLWLLQIISRCKESM